MIANYTVLLSIGAKAETFNKESLKETIRAQAIKVNFNPELAVAIATIESGLNPNAIGVKGEIGLFQLMPRGNNKTLLFNPVENTKKALEELLYWQKKCPVKNQNFFIICYNSGFRRPRYPLYNPYYKRVMEAMNEL